MYSLRNYQANTQTSHRIKIYEFNSDKGIISKIYKELQKLHFKDINLLFNKWPEKFNK